MSSETTTCPSCGNSVPANARFCPACGRTINASADGATPPANGEGTGDSMFSTPMDPGMFATGSDRASGSASGSPAEGAASTVAMGTSDLTAPTPDGGALTVNIGRAQEQG